MNCNVGNDCSHIMQLVTLVMIATTVHKLTCADWLIHDHVTWVGKMTIWVCLCSSSVWYYSPWHVLLHYMFLLCFALRCLPTVCSYYCVSQLRLFHLSRLSMYMSCENVFFRNPFHQCPASLWNFSCQCQIFWIRQVCVLECWDWMDHLIGND